MIRYDFVSGLLLALYVSENYILQLVLNSIDSYEDILFVEIPNDYNHCSQ